MPDPEESSLPAILPEGFLCLRQHEKSTEKKRPVRKKRTKDATAYCSRGYVYLIKEQYDLAIVDFDRAIAINPQFAEAYGNRGIVNATARG